MESEHRKHTRLLPHKNAFAALGPDFDKIGKIKDISRGGLAFEYFSKKDSNEETFQVNIVISDHGFYMPDAPCRIVYDVSAHMPNNSGVHFDIMSKRCGIRFGELTEKQTAQLESFLENYTTGLAPSTP